MLSKQSCAPGVGRACWEQHVPPGLRHRYDGLKGRCCTWVYSEQPKGNQNSSLFCERGERHCRESKEMHGGRSNCLVALLRRSLMRPTVPAVEPLDLLGCCLSQGGHCPCQEGQDVPSCSACPCVCRLLITVIGR